MGPQVLCQERDLNGCHVMDGEDMRSQAYKRVFIAAHVAIATKEP